MLRRKCLSTKKIEKELDVQRELFGGSCGIFSENRHAPCAGVRASARRECAGEKKVFGALRKKAAQPQNQELLSPNGRSATLLIKKSSIRRL